MKRLISRIRKADRRRLAVTIVLVSLLGAANYGISKLVGLLVAVHEDRSLSEAGTAGYVFGFLMAFLFTDVVRRIAKARDDRLARSKPATTE